MANKVVIHFLNKKILKGFTYDFSMDRDLFHVMYETENGKEETIAIKMDDLKAVFFVKDFTGNKDYQEKRFFEQVGNFKVIGKKVRVEFLDGEVIEGVSEGYHLEKKGFFLIPLDPQGNNLRIFVVFNATKSVKSM